MKIIAGISIIILISLFILVAHTSWKLVRRKIIGVKNGEVKDKIISKIINKAENTGRLEYTVYRPIIASMMLSFIYLFFKYITETYFINIDIIANDFLFTFFFMFVVLCIVGIIVSFKIWNLCREE